MKKEYRVVQRGDCFYPEWRYWFWIWRKFYFTRDCDFMDTVYIRNYKTEDEAWEFIKSKKSGKFSQYDTEE